MRKTIALLVAGVTMSAPIAFVGILDAGAADGKMAAVYTSIGPRTCAGPDTSAATASGFVTVSRPDDNSAQAAYHAVTSAPQDVGSVRVNLHLRGAQPSTTYSIADTCYFFLTTTISTNSNGVGNATFTFVPPAGQTQFVFDGYATGSGASGPGYFESSPISLP